MLRRMEKYINLFTDFGFKKIFGTEVNKDLLIDFLNELLRGRETIKDLTYLKNEHLEDKPTDRRAVFDLYCENHQGKKFIIELQKIEQKFFKDRTLYYSTFAIQEQAVKGKDWIYELQAVYTIGILDFEFDKKEKDFESVVKLVNLKNNKVFYDKYTMIYLEMPKFTKTEEELETHYDKWLYLLRNLHKLERIPKKVKEKIFEKLFIQAEIAKYEPKDRYAYEDSLKYYRDLKSSMETYLEKGVTGRKEEKVKIAKKMILAGAEENFIAEMTGLDIAEIKELKNKLDS